MTATEELRALLDERGVEWHDTKICKGFITVYEHDCITWIVTEHSSGSLSVKGCVKPTQGHYDGMTHEQAVAATLGPGTCEGDANALLRDTRAENARLRELLVGAFEDMDAWQKVIAGSNEWGYGKGCLDRLCKLRDAMQELGMEVVIG